ncbi:hypothetical protein EYC84_009834 [Monilinia fructicola]|uniref:Uncharacterized protein n=1 Tax=Monilinia fructicola TaxID=38448 RepID=A0A5M9JCD9_MONFR|nr:hypothetical protein EYC84_009834 [Monilinia fructicola]
MAMISKPIALPYWQASDPNPPPAPTIAMVCPGRTPDSLIPLYTVIPAQRTGAMASKSHSLGIRATCAAFAMQYCWNVPSTIVDRSHKRDNFHEATVDIELAFQFSLREEQSTYLYTSIITDLNIFNKTTDCDDDTSTFVTAHKWELDG